MKEKDLNLDKIILTNYNINIIPYMKCNKNDRVITCMQKPRDDIFKKVDTSILVYDNESSKEYQELIQLAKERYQDRQERFIKSFGNYCDRYAMLVLLNKSVNKKYILLDFNNLLDIILSNISGCNPDTIREIPNYSKISNSIINNLTLSEDRKANISDYSLSNFFDIDDNLDNFLFSIIANISNEINEISYKEENYKNYFIGQLRQRINKECYDFSNEITLSLRKFIRDTFGSVCIYRSRTFGTTILESDTYINEDITIEVNGIKRLISVRSYKPLEYYLRLKENKPIKISDIKNKIIFH